MIRTTLLAIAAAATITGAAATSANAGSYGHGYGYNSHYAPAYTHYAPRYYTKCFKKIVGYKRVYNYYGGYFSKPIFRRVCKRFYH